MKLKLIFFNVFSNWAFLLLRLVIGAAFAVSGWGKLQHLDKVIEYFASLNIPMPAIQAPMVAGIEFVGGVLLILGLGTRVVSLLLSGVMAVALITAIYPELEVKSDVISSIELTYLAILTVLLTSGAGCLSLDHIVAKRFCVQKSS